MDVSPTSGGTIEINKNSPVSYPANLIIENGEIVYLEAVAANGYNFANWSGDISGNTNPTNIVIDCSKKIIANFSRVEPNRWLIVGPIIGVLILGLIIGLVIRSLTT